MLAPDNSATKTLADFAVGLSYDDLPAPVVAATQDQHPRFARLLHLRRDAPLDADADRSRRRGRRQSPCSRRRHRDANERVPGRADRRDRRPRLRDGRHPRRRAPARGLARAADGARTRGDAARGRRPRADRRGRGRLRGRLPRLVGGDRKAVHARLPFPGRMRALRRGGDGGEPAAACARTQRATPSASRAPSALA